MLVTEVGPEAHPIADEGKYGGFPMTPSIQVLVYGALYLMQRWMELI
jgi:hypothetical protein